MATANRIEGIGGGTGRGSGAISVRSKSVDTGTKRMVKKQNKAAESYKIKDLDTLEKGRIARQKAKLAAEAAAKKQSNKDKAKGAAAKATPKAKPKLTKSERDFLAGQKLKAKITKRTGVYPNTAN
jgi:hypothetical protein